MKTRNLTKKKIPLIILKRVYEYCEENRINETIELKKYKKQKYLNSEYSYTLTFFVNRREFFYSHTSCNYSNFGIIEII